jgi:hypothetical protein
MVRTSSLSMDCRDGEPKMSICVIENCETRAIGRGMCSKHYTRVRNHGDPFTLKIREDGQGSQDGNGYWVHRLNGRFVRRGVLVAEHALGRRLPKGVEVHHVDENKSDDSNMNLVICESAAYHRLLHRRKRALAACGRAAWRLCNFCHRYDDQKNLYISTNGHLIIHALCQRAYGRTYRQNKKQEKGLP